MDSYMYGDPSHYADEILKPSEKGNTCCDQSACIDAYYIRQTVIEHLIPLFKGDDTEGLIKAADRIVKFIVNG